MKTSGSFTKVRAVSIILLAIVGALFLLLAPTLQAIGDAVRNTPLQPASHPLLMADQLRAEMRGNKIADPYDPRWWGTRLTPRQYNSLEQALDGFLNDVERDGSSDGALYQALEAVGIHTTNLQDAVHAANHLVNKTAKPKDSEPLPKQIEEDASGG